MRKAILSYDISRDYMGITHSRTPCWITQLIPPFALYWVNMVEDYRMHRDDPEFVRGRLNGIKSVINWYMLQIDPETGFLRADTPYWNFVDWVRTWPLGIPPSTDKSGSVLISLHFVSALEDAAKIMREFGCSAEAEAYQKTADSIKRSVYEKCWNPERGLLRDCLGGEYYSQHTNVMGILTNTIPLARQRAVFERITDPANVQGNVGRLKTGTVAIEPAAGKVSEATFYYKFYVVRAMKKVGLADGYLGLLNPWREMIDKGLTTFSENPDPCRSECHAWSSSPNYDFLATVCGVEPDSAGFASVKVQPHLGGLSFVKGIVPHPKGLIEVELERADGGLKGKVVLPSELSGRFIFGGREIPLKSGENKIDM
jgi:hypothetical protein